jgi:hypothetical protein
MKIPGLCVTMTLLLVLDVLYRTFQFFSYALAAYTFCRYYILPSFELVTKFRHPGAAVSVVNQREKLKILSSTPKLECGGFSPDGTHRRSHSDSSFVVCRPLPASLASRGPTVLDGAFRSSGGSESNLSPVYELQSVTRR